MAFVYDNLQTPANVGSGVADQFLFAPVRDFDTIACPPATGTNPGDTATIATAHTFSTGKGFLKATCAPFKNELKASTVGEVGSQKLEMKLEVMMQGSSAEVSEALRNLSNEPLIVLIKDSNCAAGMYYQLGCDCAFAWASYEFGTGTNKDGQKGYKVTFTYYSDSVMHYTAAVTLKP